GRFLRQQLTHPLPRLAAGKQKTARRFPIIAESAALRLSKNPSGRFGGPQPSKCHPNPATCAADSQALRSKVSLHCFPPGRLIEPRGKQCNLRKRTPQADFFDTLGLA